ncbi:NotI family restriction endonuclease [Streptomyces sp. DH-12]|uniref:NotI family restriction endonuclease n=1 Tax=Streptomyces sp. DH-12 TaxID=2072509 RepID=UPI001300B4F8|nr:NotI family restriction endonuclease [Streptomyces sp. DH-12]
MEIYGYPHDSTTPEAQAAQEAEHCPFSGGSCEKKKQYGFGYCSVTYRANWDEQQHTYAVCDHRLDGRPTQWAMRDYFGDQHAYLVPEVTVTQRPKLNLDYVAYTTDVSRPGEIKAIAIETQAIDLRGGGVGPAFKAWEAGEPGEWREYFTREATKKNRPDTVDYGVNTSNVYKRLGTQVAEKGTYLQQISVPLYVVMQQKILEQLRDRVNFTPLSDSDPWNITFMGFDYNGTLLDDGRLAMPHVETVRTSIEDYTRAMFSGGNSPITRGEFVAKVKRKAAAQLRQRQSDSRIF